MVGGGTGLRLAIASFSSLTLAANNWDRVLDLSFSKACLILSRIAFTCGESATVSVVGPRSVEGGESRARSRLGSPGDGEAGGGTAGEHQDYSESQEINPEAAEGSGGRAGVINVVPARYRALTDAYFKRIADENKFANVGACCCLLSNKGNQPYRGLSRTINPKP